MPKISSFLWFNNNAQEAVAFYDTVFKDCKILFSTPSIAAFEIGGQVFQALNGGDYYKLNEAFSIFVECEDQAEVDLYWDKLTAEGGEAGQCGWLKDKFGLSWQIIPKQLGQFMMGGDQAKSGRVHEAMMKMQKIIISDLEEAFNG
jgi:predicted 3-demethylubiquinone-9 3-methyltransferase (glyoxalase superfamily)